MLEADRFAAVIAKIWPHGVKGTAIFAKHLGWVKGIDLDLGTAILAVCACDPMYFSVANGYNIPVQVRIYTTSARNPETIILTPGKGVFSRNSNEHVEKIDVRLPDGSQRHYTVQHPRDASYAGWLITPEGVTLVSGH